MKIAYLDCGSGIAGDMLLAALLDAGAPAEALVAVPELLGLEGVEVRIDQVERHSIAACHVQVLTGERQPHRDWRTVRELIGRGRLRARVRDRALAVFARLAQAEATVHRTPVEEVHFHEVGALDAIVDICGAVSLLDALGVDEVVCSPLPMTGGLIRASHGALPLPAPATAVLVQGAKVYGVEGNAELVTPTGASLATTLATRFGPLPPMVVGCVGNGAGSRDLDDRPNLLRVWLGDSIAQSPRASVAVIETNLDDMLPELLPDAVESCLAAGALDVWTTPATMKKGRPGFVMSALARPAQEDRVIAAILGETTALGCRVTRVERVELDREEHQVHLDGGIVRVKVGRLNGKIMNVAPEHDDCAAVARSSARPVKAVWAEAMACARADGLA